MELIRGDERINRIAEQQKISLFQFCTQRRKVLFIIPDALSCRNDREMMFRVQGLQIQGGMNRCRILSLGAGVQNKNFYGCSSIPRRRQLYQLISNSAAAMPY